MPVNYAFFNCLYKDVHLEGGFDFTLANLSRWCRVQVTLLVFYVMILSENLEIV